MADIVTVSDIERTWPVEIKGEVVQLPRPSVELVEKRYIQYLRQQELKGIRETHKPGSKDYHSAMEILQTGFNTRFLWGSKHFRTSLEHDANMLMFMLFWMQSIRPDVTEADVKAAYRKSMDETGKINETITDEANYVPNPFWQSVFEAVNDPNR